MNEELHKHKDGNENKHTPPGNRIYILKHDFVVDNLDYVLELLTAEVPIQSGQPCLPKLYEGSICAEASSTCYLYECILCTNGHLLYKSRSLYSAG